MHSLDVLVRQVRFSTFTGLIIFVLMLFPFPGFNFLI